MTEEAEGGHRLPVAFHPTTVDSVPIEAPDTRE